MLKTFARGARSLLLALILLCIATFSFAQKTVRGQVTNRNGQPVAGASVQVKGTRTGVLTDDQGNFTISQPALAIFPTKVLQD